MGEVYSAPAPEQRIKPAYTVEKLDGTFKKTVYKRDSEKGLVQTIVEAPRGYMVRMLKGHSIHIETYKELERLGFAGAVPLVDVAEGEKVGSIPSSVAKPAEIKKGS